MVPSGARSMAKTRPRGTGCQGFPRRGEIYLTTLDPAVGHEMKKTRPALVIQNDIANRFGMTTIVAAITSKVSASPYPNEVVLDPSAWALLFRLQFDWTKSALLTEGVL